MVLRLPGTYVRLGLSRSRQSCTLHLGEVIVSRAEVDLGSVLVGRSRPYSQEERI
jgi:hypothetical protein